MFFFTNSKEATFGNRLVWLRLYWACFQQLASPAQVETILFTWREHLWQNADMKLDAFEGAFEGLESGWSFSYKKQLREAMSAIRRELDKTVHLYVSRFPDTGYRTLARRLHISPAMLCKILRPFLPGRKRGRRKAQRTEQPNRSAPALRMSVPVSRHLKRKDVEQDLTVLHLCVLNHRADDAGDDAYQNLSDWLRKGNGTKTMLQRVGYLTQRYESLRSKKYD